MGEALIRAATAADMPRVWELIIELAEFEKLAHQVVGSLESLTNSLGRDFECFVYEVDGLIVAYTLSFQTFSTFRTKPGIWLEDLYVTPDWRGKGLGKLMLSNLISIAEERGFGRVEWSVLDWNVDAIGFYEKMGATLFPEWRTCRVSLS